MKIAFLVPALPGGGLPRLVTRLANALAGQSTDVLVLVAGATEQPFDLDRAVDLVHLPDVGAETIVRHARSLGVDVISDHGPGTPDHLAAMRQVAQEVPVVVSAQGLGAGPLPGHAAQGFSGFAAVACPTLAGADLLASIVDNVVSMPDPVSPEDAEPTDGRSRRIVTASRLPDAAERLDRHLDAFASLIRRVPPPVLRIVGEVGWRHFQMLCLERGLPPAAFELTGSATDLEPHIRAASIYATTAETATHPIALRQAAAHGLPQVAYASALLEDEVVDGETGFLVAPGDTDAFAARLEALLRDPDLRRRMGARARDRVLTAFSVGIVAQRWLRLFENVVERGAPPADLIVVGKAAVARPEGTPEAARSPTGRAIKVTVIVPVFETERLLGRCLDSLLHQTLRDIEIVVVDDASPGDVADVMADYLKRDARLVFVSHEVNRGLYQARSTGARLARGTFIAHVDSDDYVHPDFLRRLYETAVLTGADIVECGAMEVSVDGRRKQIEPPPQREMRQPMLFEAFVRDEIKHVVWNKLYRRSFWDSTGLHMDVGLELSITEDLLRNVPLFHACRKYVFIDAVLYFYVRRELSIVTEGDFARMLRKLSDINAVYTTAIDYLAAAGEPEAVLAAFRDRQLTDLMWYMGHGYREAKHLDRSRMLQAIAAHDIFGAVAIRQATMLLHLQGIEAKYAALLARLPPDPQAPPALASVAAVSPA